MDNAKIPDNIKTKAQLRDTYLRYIELKHKGQLRLKKSKLSNTAIDFDLNSQSYFYKAKEQQLFAHPESQFQCYDNILKSLQKDLKPIKDVQYCDHIGYSVMKLAEPKFTSKSLKVHIISAFKRRIDSLNIRKVRMISRSNEQNSKYPTTNYEMIFKARLQVVDSEILQLHKRVQRIKIDEQYDEVVMDKPLQTKHYVSTKPIAMQQNLTFDDVDIYLRSKVWSRKICRPFKKLRTIIKWVHCHQQFEIIEQSTQLLAQMAESHIQVNEDYYKQYCNYLQINNTPWLNMLKAFRFEGSDDRNKQTLKKRYDRVPFLISNQDQAIKQFQLATQLYIDKQHPDSTISKQIYQATNLCHMIEGLHKYIMTWETIGNNEYAGFGGIQKLLIELSGFDDYAELKESLKIPLALYSNIQFKVIPNDWIHLLDLKNVILDEYTEFIRQKFNFVTIDVYTQKIVQLLPLSMLSEMKQQIINEVKQLRQNDKFVFNVIDNNEYVEQSREGMRLNQINQLFDIHSKQKLSHNCRSTIRSDLLQKIDNIIAQSIPQESILEARLAVQVAKMRDYRRKILLSVNGMLAIQRRLTFDLLSIRKCKVHNVVDSEYLSKVNEERNKNNDKNQLLKDVIPVRRKAVISFVKAELDMKDRMSSGLSNEAKLGKRIAAIVYTLNEAVPDVIVRYKQQSVIYDKSIEIVKSIMERITRQISFYINKYEKLCTIQLGHQLIDRFQCVLDCLQCEANYQFKKLQLLQSYVKVYENVCDPLKAYQIIERMFNLIEQIPLLDSESYYFQDSYVLSSKVLDSERECVELLHMQVIQQETQQTQLQQKNHIVVNRQKSMKSNQSSVQQLSRNSNQLQKEKLNEIQEQYYVNNRMAEIFNEINRSKEDYPSVQCQEQNNNEDPKLEMSPFWIYEGYDDLNYVEHAYLTYDIMLIQEQGFRELLSQTKPSSIIGILSLNIAYLNQIKYEIINQKPAKFEPIESNTLLESDVGLLEHFFTMANQTIYRDIQLESLQSKGEDYISDVQIVCNLLEYCHLRERFLGICMSTKVMHRIYRKQRNQNKINKFQEIYLKGSQFNQETKKKKTQFKECFSSYIIEVEGSLEQPLKIHHQPELILFNTVIDEFRNMVMYDRTNLHRLIVQNRKIAMQIYEHSKLECDWKCLQNYGFLNESSKLTNREIVLDEMADKMLPRKFTLWREKCFQQNSFLISNKFEMMKVMESKIDSRKSVSVKIDQAIYTVDRIKSKVHVIRKLILDLLLDAKQNAICYEIALYQDAIQHLLNILPMSEQLYPLKDSFLIVPGTVNLDSVNPRARIENMQQSYDNNNACSLLPVYQYHKDRHNLQNWKQLKQYKHYLQFLKQHIFGGCVKLNWWETLHLTELYLFNLNFETYDLSKELVYQRKHEDCLNPIKSILSYDKDILNPKEVLLNEQFNQQTLVSQALDVMIEKIKNYHSIRTVFQPYVEEIKNIHNTENLQQQLKNRRQQLFAQLFYCYYEGQLQIVQNYPEAEYPNQLHLINSILFQNFQLNAINLKHFNTEFRFMKNQHQMSDSIQYNFFKKSRQNPHFETIIQLLLSLPIQHKLNNIIGISNSPYGCSEFDRQLVRTIQLSGQISAKDKITTTKLYNNPYDKEAIRKAIQLHSIVRLDYPTKYPIPSFQQQFYLSQLKQQIRDRDISLHDKLYESLVSQSQQALGEEIQLFQNMMNGEPEYEDRSKLQDKLVAKVNAALPRVKFIQSLSSTFTQANRQIPNSIKLAFIQGFLNRLKNKASQVELLSSGFGYIISSKDLEDCINLLNRELFNFAEKEISTRMDTFNYLYENLKQQLTTQQQQLDEQIKVNQQMRDSFDDILQAQVIAKSNQLLFEYELLKQQYKDLQQCTNGLEDKIRTQLDSQYRLERDQLIFDRDTIVDKFNKFKSELTVLCKQEVKNKQETILRYISQKTSDILSETSRVRRYNMEESQIVAKQPQMSDQIFDAYQFTKGMHQITEDYTKQLEQTKQGYEKQLTQYRQQEIELNELKLTLQESRRKENIIKVEIINLQQTISSLQKQKEGLVKQNEELEFDKKRLQKNNEDINQKLRQMSDKNRTVEIRRRGAVSVENESRLIQSYTEQNKNQLPSLEMRKPRMKIDYIK